ncbi:MAG: hypothetical protein DWQ07_25760 [Chloroflexi bacterium]|nr:MAG: hypothetical protein DWQ07_25760 [Chloroflexota bacterium]
MGYLIRDIKEFTSSLDQLLDKGGFKSNEEEIAFDIISTAQESHLNGSTLVIEDKNQIDFIVSHNLDSYFVEKDEKGTVQELDTVTAADSDDLQTLDSFEQTNDEAILENIRADVESGDEAKLREAINDLVDLVSKPGSIQDQAQQLLTQAQRIQGELTETLETNIQTALAEDDPYKAEEYFKRLEILRPDLLSIEEIKQKIVDKYEQDAAESEIQRAKRLLQEHDDYPDLLNGLRLARKFISERPNHPGISELQNFIDDAEKVRREFAYKIEGAQTMGAMQQFEEQVKAYAELIDKQVFRVEDPDDPTKEVSTAELQQKALENLRQARESTVKDRCAEAEKIIESEPGVALLYLEQLSEFIEEFKGTDTYSDYSKVKLKVDSNHKKWLESQDIISDAADLLEPRARLAEYQKAHNIFPGFTALPELIQKAQTELRAKIKQEATIKLNAALRQLKFNLQSIPFREIDQELKDVGEIIRELGDPEGVLLDVQKDLDNAFKKLDSIESRHIAIKQSKEKIESGLKKDPPDLQDLREILEDLPEEDQAHALLRDVRIRIGRLSSEQNTYEDAVRALDRKDFPEAIELARAINPRGDLAKQRRELLFESQLQLDLLELNKTMAALDYNKARSLIDSIDGRINEEHPEFGQFKQVGSELQKYEAETKQFQKDFKKEKSDNQLDLTKRLKGLNNLIKKYPNRQALFVEIQETRDLIRTSELKKIRQIKTKVGRRKKKNITYEEAYLINEASLILERVNLAKSSDEVELVRWARITYRQAEIRYLSTMEDWDKIIDNVHQEYGDSPPIHVLEQLNKAKKAKAIAEVREYLSSGNFGMANEVLSQAIKENGQLREAVDIALLQSVVNLFLQDIRGAELSLKTAERIDENNKEIAQIKQIVAALPQIRRRLDEASLNFEQKSYSILNALLDDLDTQFDGLLAIVKHPEASTYLIQLQSDFKEKKEEWISSSLNHLAKQLDETNRSTAEKLLTVFQIQKIDPENVSSQSHLQELAPQIPEGIASELEKIEVFCDGQYQGLPIVEAYQEFLDFETELSAFLDLENHIANVIPEDLVNGLNASRKELRIHRNLFDELKRLLTPYLDFMSALEQQREPSSENLCIAYEKGLDQFERINEIRANPIMERYQDNPDVRSFENWIAQTDKNIREIKTHIGEIKKGIDYKLGHPVTWDEPTELWVKKYMMNFQAISDACEEIKGLSSGREGDIYNIDKETRFYDDHINDYIEGIDQLFSLAKRKKETLQKHYEWYQTLSVLIVPKVEKGTADREFSNERDDLPEMVFSETQRGKKQEVERLQNALGVFDNDFNSLPDLPQTPLDSISERLLEEGRPLEENLRKQRDKVANDLQRLEQECSKFGEIKTDTEKKLSTRRPSFRQIRKNLIDLYRIDPTDMTVADLLNTYREKFSKRR